MFMGNRFPIKSEENCRADIHMVQFFMRDYQTNQLPKAIRSYVCAHSYYCPAITLSINK